MSKTRISNHNTYALLVSFIEYMRKWPNAELKKKIVELASRENNMKVFENPLKTSLAILDSIEEKHKKKFVDEIKPIDDTIGDINIGNRFINEVLTSDEDYDFEILKSDKDLENDIMQLVDTTVTPTEKNTI